MKILIVEDEAISAMLLKRLLSRMGHDPVASTARGEQVLELVTTYDPDLVLMDISLAGEMTGIEAAVQLRTVSAAGVVFTTGYDTDEIRHQALSVPRSLFLTKPIIESELMTAIDALPREPAE